MDITKSREEFEKWAEEVGALPWGYLKKQRTPSGGYSVQIYQYMWKAWQASRESLVVELPAKITTKDIHWTTPNKMREALADKLIHAGIRIKGESE